MKHANNRFSKRRLEKLIGELTSLAKDICPEAEIVEVLIPGYEELDAWIGIVVPDEKEEAVSDALSLRRDEIFMNEDYSIGLGISERSHYEAVQTNLNATV
jgi:hypothetical protein